MVKRSGGFGRALARGFLRTAVWLYRRSGGRIGGTMFGGPVLLLTTTGRRSGRSWTVPLLYQPDGDRWVIIASNGGSARHPAWWLNLRAQPDASVQIGRETVPVTAVEVTGAERDSLWRRMADMYRGYDRYAQQTTRTIPVVVLQKLRFERSTGDHSLPGC
jgi:deazaflavin-dependent oxidoreductase (nitroreductase family)